MINNLTTEQNGLAAALGLKLLALGGGSPVFHSFIEGPLVETFYFKLSSSTPLNKIMGKGEDFAFACGRESAVVIREGSIIGIQISRK